MGKNRDRLSIVAAILDAANFGASKTRIMLQANLSFGLLEKYLEIAVNAGFIAPNNGKYNLTEHGKNFYREYKHFYERYDKAQRILESLDSERDRLARLCNRYGLPETMKTEIDAE